MGGEHFVGRDAELPVKLTIDSAKFVPAALLPQFNRHRFHCLAQLTRLVRGHVPAGVAQLRFERDKQALMIIKSTGEPGFEQYLVSGESHHRLGDLISLYRARIGRLEEVIEGDIGNKSSFGKGFRKHLVAFPLITNDVLTVFRIHSISIYAEQEAA